MNKAKEKHIPVLLNEVIELLDLQPTDVIIDGTLGLGGHTKAFAEVVEESGRIIGFDLDSGNLKEAQKTLKNYQGTITYINDSYSTIGHYLKVLKLPEYNKVLLDLGVSSPHFDDPERGFTFREAGPLDMRFDRNKNKLTASAILHKASPEQLENILRNYGEVSSYKKVTKIIIKERDEKRFRSTKDFADRLLNHFNPKEKNKTLAQIFQALRIAVNNELNTLQEGLTELWEHLTIGGYIAIISYHSLEDRIAKQFFAEKLKSCICPKEVLKCECRGEPAATKITKKVVKAKKAEVEANPRARSAKLRVYKKLLNT